MSVLKEVQNTLSSLEQTLTTQNVHIQVGSDHINLVILTIFPA